MFLSRQTEKNFSTFKEVKGGLVPSFLFSIFRTSIVRNFIFVKFSGVNLCTLTKIFRTSQSQILMRVKFRAGANPGPCQIFNELELNKLEVVDSWDEGRSWNRSNYKKIRELGQVESRFSVYGAGPLTFMITGAEFTILLRPKFESFYFFCYIFIFIFPLLL